MSTIKFSLLWDSHKSHVADIVANMYRNETFCDCTLIGAGGASLPCHKLVLSSFSPVLKSIIENYQDCDNPVITLCEVSPTELAAVVNFLYTGETSFPAEMLAGFLSICQMLEILGFELQVLDNSLPIDILPEDNFLPVESENEKAIDNLIVPGHEDVVFIDQNDFHLNNEFEIKTANENTSDSVGAKEKRKKPIPNGAVQMKKKYRRVLLKSQPKNDLNLDAILDLGENHARRYQCKKCGNQYSHKRTITHHLFWICGQPPTHACKFCDYRGKRRFQLKSHLLRVHQISLVGKKTRP